MLAQVPTLTFAKKHLISFGFLFFATFAAFGVNWSWKGATRSSFLFITYQTHWHQHTDKKKVWKSNLLLQETLAVEGRMEYIVPWALIFKTFVFVDFRNLHCHSTSHLPPCKKGQDNSSSEVIAFFRALILLTNNVWKVVQLDSFKTLTVLFFLLSWLKKGGDA